MPYTDPNKVEARLISKAKKLGASDEEINAAIGIPSLIKLVDRYGAMSTERTGPPEEAPLLPRKKPRQNKGGLSQKPKFMKGGSYKGKSHMYAAGGMVKELKI